MVKAKPVTIAPVSNTIPDGSRQALLLVTVGDWLKLIEILERYRSE
jgi:hypothetical protein